MDRHDGRESQARTLDAEARALLAPLGSLRAEPQLRSQWTAHLTRVAAQVRSRARLVRRVRFSLAAAAGLLLAVLPRLAPSDGGVIDPLRGAPIGAPLSDPAQVESALDKLDEWAIALRSSQDVLDECGSLSGAQTSDDEAELDFIVESLLRSFEPGT